MPIRDFRSLSTWMKLALVFLSLGVLLFVIGFATDSWMVRYHGYGYRVDARGLWNSALYCRQGWGCRVPDYHRATQAMECIGLIAMLLAFLLLLLYVFVDSCRRREAMLAVIFFLFGAVVTMVIGYIIFATKLEEVGFEVGWSMGVAIAGTICVFIAAIMCILHIQAR